MGNVRIRVQSPSTQLSKRRAKIIISAVKHNAWLIVNPMAGPTSTEKEVEVVTRFWEARGWRVKACCTRSPGHAATLAREAAAAGCQMVLAAGGDGTMGQIAHGLAGSPTMLAPLPIGTANAFAKLLNLVPPSQMVLPDLETICLQLAEGKVHTVDLGLAHASGLPASGYRFLSWAGTGLDGYVIDRVEPRPKWVKQMGGGRLGWVAYVLLGAPSVMRFHGIRARIEVDDQTVNGNFVLALISNSRLYGGGLVRLTDENRLDDNLLDVWLFKGAMFMETLGHAARMLTSRHLLSESTIHLRGRHILVNTSKPATVQLDGEPAGHTPLQVEIEPGCLKLLVPRDAPTSLFSHPGTCVDF